MNDIASAFGAKAFNCSDDPLIISELINEKMVEETCLFNVNTNELFWHAGAGVDDPNTFDRHREFSKNLEINHLSNIINEAWKKCQSSL